MKITINTQPKADEDIFKPGTLVVNEDGWIVLVSDLEGCGAQYFSATIINQALECRTHRVGEHCKGWKRSEFVKFIGNIVLEQE